MRELKNESRKSIVYIDRIKFTFHKDFNYLNDLTKNKQVRVTRVVRNSDTPCCIDISQPSPECLRNLQKVFAQNKIKYFISYIEISRDIAYPSQSSAESAKHQLSKFQRKKYSGGMTYDGRDQRMNLKKGYISDSTDYHGSPAAKINKQGNVNINIFGNFKFSIYVKISPKLDCECLHEEFRITRANKIFKKTGIKNIEGLLEADLDLIFKKLESKYIIYQRINTEKLGLSLLGLRHCRKPSDRLKMKAQLYGLIFKQKYGMKPLELISRLMIEKKRLRLKEGGKSAWQKRILKLEYNRFIKRIERPL